MAYAMHTALLQALISIGFLLANPSGIEPIHVDANGGFTTEELIGRSENKAVHSHDHQYTLVKVELKIHTRRASFLAVPDTGSDVVWTKHKSMCSDSPMVCSNHDASGMCEHCTGGLCTFKRWFGSGKKTATGYIAKGALTLSRRKSTTSTTAEINNYIVYLGCVIDEDGDHLLPESADGIVGLNRGPMSLVQQQHANNFAYCLGNILKPKVPGRLWLGDDVLALLSSAKKSNSYSLQASRGKPVDFFAWLC